MTFNNTGLYDAIIAGIALSNGAWASETNASDYAPEANAAVAIATEVDAGIPTIAGGATVSQRLVMQTVTKGCMTGRVAISMQPGDYSAVAAGIIAVYTEFVTQLQDTSTGGAFQNLSNVMFVDGTTALPTGSQTGNIELPYALLSTAITNVAAAGVLWLTPHDYTAQGTITVSKNLSFRAFATGSIFSALTQTASSFSSSDINITGVFTGIAGSQTTFKNTSIGSNYVGSTSTVSLDTVSIGGTFASSTLTAHLSSFVGAITLAGTTASFKNCTFTSGNITFSGAAGIATMDGFSYGNWLLSGGTITNGSIVVDNSLPSANVAVTVPILANGEVEYVNVDVSGTILKGILTNTPIAANPTEDLAPGGTGGAAYCPAARVSATNTVRLTVVGPITPAKNTHFVITQLAAK